MSLGAMDVLGQYDRTMAAAIEPSDDPLFGGALKTTTTRALRRPAVDAPWAPTGRTSSSGPAVPRPSGAQRRGVVGAVTTLPHLDEAARSDAALPLPPELAARFRTLCALRAADPARVIEGLVRSYVILGLSQGGGR